MKNKKKIFRRIKIIIVIYCLLGTALYYLQDTLLLRPTAINADSAYHFNQPFTEVNLDWDTNTRFNMIQFTVPDSIRKGIVLYFHGNRENVNHYAIHAKNFTRNGYEVWMPDYPGFGKSTGKITEQLLYDEALQVYKMARQKYAPADIIIYGKSLGTGIAAQLASVRDCKKLILETPYYSMTSLVRLLCFMYPVDLLLKYKIPVWQYFTKITAPISIFHGTADGTIPYTFNASRLKAYMKPGDEFITVDGGSHNNLTDYPLVQQKLDSLLSE